MTKANIGNSQVVIKIGRNTVLKAYRGSSVLYNPAPAAPISVSPLHLANGFLSTLRADTISDSEFPNAALANGYLSVLRINDTISEAEYPNAVLANGYLGVLHIDPIVIPPNAPTALVATAGNSQISLAWTAPSAPGTSAITGYSVEYTPSGGSAQTVSTSSTSTSYTLTGLTNGTAYTVRVAGVSSAGAGTFTAASSSVTPAAPSPVTLNNGSGSGTSASKWTLVTGPWPACDFQGRFITAGSAVTVLVDSVSTGGPCSCDGEQYANIAQRNASGTALNTAHNQEFSGRSFTLAAGDYLSVDITCSLHMYRAWLP